MAKLQRELNPMKLEQAKQRTMTAVMDRIEQSHTKTVWRKIMRPVLLPTMALILVLAILFFPEGQTPTPPDDPFTVHETETLVELTYLSSSFIGADLTVYNPSLMFLADTDETEFEKEDAKINFYFDTLRVYLEDIDFTEVVQTEELTDSEFDYLITFDLHEKTYQFYVSIDGETIVGELVVGGFTYQVTGTLEESDNETSFDLEAINGDDYVRIQYKYESEDEIETKYEVQTRLNGVESEQEIKISIEDDEAKVELKDGNNEYTLNRETEDGVTEYKLEYKINGVEGEANIIESVDTNGNTVYQYSVKEGDVEKDIERGRPHYDHDEDDEDDDDNPGNGNQNSEDEEDEEDEDEFPGNDNPGNQSYDSLTTPTQKSL